MPAGKGLTLTEINRLVTDRFSDLLFTPDRLSSANLRQEGVPNGKHNHSQ
jgi:UDP-N-acetylglucosamine 2-epimerase